MSDGTRQELHRVNLNSGKPTLPKKEREKIKEAVFQCEQAYKSGVTSPEYLKQFNSAVGRVNTLNRMHPAMGTKLKKRLLSAMYWLLLSILFLPCIYPARHFFT